MEKIIDIKTIEHMAELGNLTLTPEEKELFARQGGEILQYVSQLKKVDAADVEPIAQIAGLENIVREDRTIDGLKIEEVLQNSENKQNNMFKVKKVLKNEDN